MSAEFKIYINNYQKVDKFQLGMSESRAEIEVLRSYYII